MYQTGTFTGTETVADLLTLIKDFAVDNGWTVDASTSSTLRMHADQCFLNMSTDTTVTVNDAQGSTANNNSPDHRIYQRLSEDTTAVSTTTADRVVTNDLLGPYAKYWLYSDDGAGGPKYVYFVLQKANGRYCSLGFGNLDKKGASYTGGAFCHGMHWAWWFNRTNFTDPVGDFSNEGSDITSGNHITPWQVESGVASWNVYLGDLTATQKVISGYNGNGYDRIAPVYDRGGIRRSIANTRGYGARFLGHIFMLGPNPANNITPMFEVPLYWGNNTSQRLRFIGTVPDYRLMSMIKRKEGETVSFASDEYDVYPFKRALPWNPEPYFTKTVTSGPYGFSIKKNA